MTPPQRLRRELEDRRDHGETFETAWPEAVTVAVKAESTRTQAWWTTVVTDQRNVWRANYAGRRGRRCSLRTPTTGPSAATNTLVA